VSIELPERLEKYMSEFEDDVKLNMSNVKDKSLLITSIQSKWIRYYFTEKTLNQKLKDAKVEYSKQHGNKIEFKQTLPGMSQPTEIDIKLVKLNNELKTSEMCLDFMEKSMAVLDKFNFQVKNIIDLVRLEIN
jgi:hypothetical protein